MQEISMNRTAHMNLALERLRTERILHKQTSEFQIKVGSYSFYPGKGTIYMDLDREARPERGLDTFIALLRKLKDRNPRLFEMKETSRRSAECRVNKFDISEAIKEPEGVSLEDQRKAAGLMT